MMKSIVDTCVPHLEKKKKYLVSDKASIADCTVCHYVFRFGGYNAAHLCPDKFHPKTKAVIEAQPLMKAYVDRMLKEWDGYLKER